MKHIILAPHADDEIIGGWQVLRDQQADVRVIYDEPPTEKERKAFWSFFPWVHLIHVGANPDREGLVDVVKELASCKDARCYFPDPIYELHPLHRMWGNVGASLFQSRRISSVTFYTTNMNAPYMREVQDVPEKRDALDTIYPDKADLWRYDHKYFLFGGMYQWL